MKLKTEILTGVLFVLFALLGCNQQIELEQPEYERKVVVDGSIETGQPARIYLTMSSPYLTHYDSASIRETFLNYAKITLTSSKGEEEILTLFREDQFFPPFVYKSLLIKGETGVRYNIKVEVKGKEVDASTTIPAPPEIVDTRFISETDSSGYVEYAVSPSSDKMYLFTRVASSLADENLHPAYRPVSAVESGAGSPDWQRVFRSRANGLYLLNPESDFYYEWPRYQYSLQDTVRMAVGTVDIVSYEVLRSLFYDRSNHENPFAFRREGLKSKIDGGLGRWTGIGISEIFEVTGQNNPSNAD